MPSIPALNQHRYKLFNSNNYSIDRLVSVTFVHGMRTHDFQITVERFVTVLQPQLNVGPDITKMESNLLQFFRLESNQIFREVKKSIVKEVHFKLPLRLSFNATLLN